MWWIQRFTKMRQDFPNRPRIGDEADQPDIATTVGTRQVTEAGELGAAIELAVVADGDFVLEDEFEELQTTGIRRPAGSRSRGDGLCCRNGCLCHGSQNLRPWMGDPGGDGSPG